MTREIFVHPSFPNLAGLKAAAAALDMNVRTSPNLPPELMIAIDVDELELPPKLPSWERRAGRR